MADKKISALTSATTPLAGTEVLPIVQSGSTVKVSAANLTVGRNVTTADLYAIGNLGVNTNTPSAPLHIYRNTTNGTNANVLAQNDGATGSYAGFQAIAGSVDFQIFSDAAGNAIGAPGTMMRTNSNTPLLFGINSSEVARFDTSGNLVPKTAAKGINFTANSAAAGMTSQLLNWYEEGTWTPTDASGAGLTFTSATGRYTRMGNVVFLFGYVQYPITASGANASIGGLPFTVNASAAATQGGVTYSQVATVRSVGVQSSTTTATVYTLAGGVATNADLSATALYFNSTYFV
jgi:hypothetical protein